MQHKTTTKGKIELNAKGKAQAVIFENSKNPKEICATGNKKVEGFEFCIISTIGLWKGKTPILTDANKNPEIIIKY